MQSPFDNPLGPGGSDGIEAVRERLRGLQENAARAAENAQELASRLETLTASATDDSHACTVTVDFGGHVTELVLTERIRNRQPEWISAVILETIAAARKRLAEATRETVEETLGADSATGQAILKRLGGETEPER